MAAGGQFGQVDAGSLESRRHGGFARVGLRTGRSDQPAAVAALADGGVNVEQDHVLVTYLARVPLTGQVRPLRRAHNILAAARVVRAGGVGDVQTLRRGDVVTREEVHAPRVVAVPGLPILLVRGALGLPRTKEDDGLADELVAGLRILGTTNVDMESSGQGGVPVLAGASLDFGHVLEVAAVRQFKHAVLDGGIDGGSDGRRVISGLACRLLVGVVDGLAAT